MKNHENVKDFAVANENAKVMRTIPTGVRRAGLQAAVALADTVI